MVGQHQQLVGVLTQPAPRDLASTPLPPATHFRVPLWVRQLRAPVVRYRLPPEESLASSLTGVQPCSRRGRQRIGLSAPFTAHKSRPDSGSRRRRSSRPLSAFGRDGLRAQRRCEAGAWAQVREIELAGIIPP